MALYFSLYLTFQQVYYIYFLPEVYTEDQPTFSGLLIFQMTLVE